MTRALPAVFLIVLSASAHRLDEYLQGTILSVAKGSVQAEMTLTPGVAVFPALIADIDTNGDGAISQAEQQAYAERVLRDLSLSIDGRTLVPRLTSAGFPAIGEMKEGRGEIHLAFQADLPPGGAHRRLILENRHESKIAAYQVNVLVPRDPDIRVERQNRNYTQSHYELEFVQSGVESSLRGPIETLALIAAGWLALVWGVRGRPNLPHLPTLRRGDRPIA